jgi:hypothetical protein
MMTILAHFDGKRSLVLDGPVDLPVGTPLRIQVDVGAQLADESTTQRVPLTLDVESVRAMAADPAQPWRPLDVNIDPELGRAIAENPAFNIEES